MDGRRHVEFRSTMEEAEARATEIRDEHDQIGAAAINLTPDQRLAAARAFKRLGPGVPLDGVLDFWFQNHSMIEQDVTVKRVQEELLAAQIRRGLRPESIIGTRTRYATFVEKYADRPISEIRTDDVSVWLKALTDSAQTTIGNKIRYLNVFFQYAVKHGYVATNPMARIERPRKKYKVPEFLTTGEVQKLLEAAEEHDGEMAAKMAIGFFAGIRPEELNKLDWSDIKMDDEIITIRPDVAKCGVPRHVAIQPNLKEWLMAYRKLSGVVGWKTKAFNIHRRELMKKANVVHWPHDCMRHTFATMHLAAFEDAAKTAFELGHTQGTRLLYQHYRGLTTKGSATEFWNTRPGKAGIVGELVTPSMKLGA